MFIFLMQQNLFVHFLNLKNFWKYNNNKLYSYIFTTWIYKETWNTNFMRSIVYKEYYLVLVKNNLPDFFLCVKIWIQELMVPGITVLCSLLADFLDVLSKVWLRFTRAVKIDWYDLQLYLWQHCIRNRPYNS